MKTSLTSQQVDSTNWRVCDACGAQNAKFRLARDGYDIVECRACNLVYVAQEVTRAQLDAYYGSGYYSGQQNAYSDYLARSESRKHHYRSMLPSIKKHLLLQAGERAQVRVLDVGCAAGYFLEVAQEAGWSAQGIEISPYMSAYARDERGLNVLTGTLEEAKLPIESFDLVTMWDVIEHVQNPSRVLARAQELLAPNGLLVVSTGDVCGVTARVYRDKWALIAPPGHLFYFSRRTLGGMLQKAGLSVLGWQSDGAFLINKREENPTGMTRLSQSFHQQRIINALLRRLRWGSIMTIYARKPL